MAPALPHPTIAPAVCYPTSPCTTLIEMSVFVVRYNEIVL